MGRYYRFSKKLTPEQSEKIIMELKELYNVKNVEISENHSRILIETIDDEFSVVMGMVVNACRRIVGECEVSFEKFAVQD